MGMVGSYGGLIAPVTIVAVIGLYIRWLQIVEPIYDREERIREGIKGDQFAKEDIDFHISRVSILENEAFEYKLKKRLPVARRLEGQTEVTLRAEKRSVSVRADGIGLEEYFRSRQSIDDFLGDKYPSVEYTGTSSIQEGSETKILIDSLNVHEIQASLEQIPVYLLRMFEDYPGEAELKSDSESHNG